MKISATKQVFKQAQQRGLTSLVELLNALTASRPIYLYSPPTTALIVATVSTAQAFCTRVISSVRSFGTHAAHRGNSINDQLHIRGLATLAASG